MSRASSNHFGPHPTGPHRMGRRDVLAGMAAAGIIAARPAHGQTAPGAGHQADEPALEPQLAIIDPHHHFRDFRDPADPRPRYRVAELMADIDGSGHNITQTVFAECSIMYRPDGPPELRSLGETEYVRGLAQAADRALQGRCRVAAGIIGRVNLTAGTDTTALLQRHIEASGGRLRGIRNSIAWDAYAPLAAMGLNKDLFANPDFLMGLKALAPLDLAFDVWLFHPQIPQLTALARAYPDTVIVLNHCGNPLGIGPYAGREGEVRVEWKQAMAELAGCHNVIVKLGGLGPFWTPPPGHGARLNSDQLAAQWRPYIESCIELFGASRCMFESNYPANAGTGSYGATWNAFKQITRAATDDEKHWLYRQTARATYRI